MDGGVDIPILQSLADLRELIVDCLDICEARSVTEIGAATGAFTAVLGAWAETRSAIVHAVEPSPSQQLLDVAARWPAVDVVPGRSPACLRAIGPCDAYVIDGDHNHHTVLAELSTIAEIAGGGGRQPLILLHDVGWPWGRRDSYYAPELLPRAGVRPHSLVGGVVPGNQGLADLGVLDAGAWAAALEEGGPANGVQTAVDDFLAGDTRYDYLVLPLVFGLGIMFPRQAGYADRLGDRYRPFDGHPVLRRIEENRLRLIMAAQASWRAAERSRLVVEDHARLVAERAALMADGWDGGKAQAHLTRARLDLDRIRADRDRLTLHLLDAEQEVVRLERESAELRRAVAGLEQVVAERDQSLIDRDQARPTRWLHRRPGRMAGL